ncbi:MAG TPA: SDR family oxidoreductase [Burkholderiales bacterium]|nr:SDR family oxidoreductase [Burkholderiales bacterium]
MDLGLKQRVVLITGGSRGIGLACAKTFLHEGARVAIASRSREHLDRAAAELAGSGPVATFVADLARPEDAASLANRAEKQLGPIDVLVNSAGAAKRYLPEALGVDAWHDAMDAKYFTYVHAMEAVLPRMRERRRGAVVNIIGMGGKIAGPMHLPGGAANAALMLASVGLASVYGRHGVRINAINPGQTMTDRVKEFLALESKARGVDEQALLADMQAKLPLGRIAQPEDVANLALFLASDKASYLTGVIVPMDGGANPII